MKWLASLCGLGALAVAWLTFGPIALGGSAAYAMIVGTSMEPRLHRGDIAVVRKASDVGVGDVVAFESRALGRTVLHRIIGVDGGRYVTKGDNNDFVDPGRVERGDVIGTYWFKVGGAAPVFEWFHEPLHAAIVAAGLGLLLFGGGTVTVRKRGRRRRESPAPAPSRRRGDPVLWNLWAPAASVAALAALAFAALAAVSFHAQDTRPAQVDNLYAQHGRFSYGAEVPRTAAYPSGRVSSGDAVFVRLVPELPVRFDWRFATTRPHFVHGTASLAATLTDNAGWSQRLVLARERRFTGDRLALRGSLDLSRIQRVLRRFEHVTGTNAGVYQLTLTPRVRVDGHVDGARIGDSFAPPLQLSLDDLRLQLATSAEPGQPNRLTRTATASGTELRPNELRFLVLRAPVEPARKVALAGLALALAALAALLAYRRFAAAPTEAERLRARYGRWIVAADHAALPSRVVDVARFDELVRIAERYDRLIIDPAGDGGFHVIDDGVAYRWREQADASAALERLAGLIEQADAAPVTERRDHATRPWAAPPTASAPEERALP